MNKELKNYSVLQFLKDEGRACEQSCHYCPVSSYNNMYHMGCTEFKSKYPQEYLKLIYKWANENPEPFNPKSGEYYWYNDISIPAMVNQTMWLNDKVDEHRLKHNFCFKTKEEAIARAKELLGIKEED